MEVQHINKIGVEALEALLYTAHHVLAVVAAGIGVGLVVVQAVLGSHHPVVAVMLVDKRSHNFFTHTILIAVGGIQKITTGIAKGFHNTEAGGFVYTPGSGGAKTHGTEAEFTYFEATAAKEFVLHSLVLNEIF